MVKPSGRYTPPKPAALKQPRGFKAAQRKLAQKIYGYCLGHDELVTDVDGRRIRWWIDPTAELGIPAGQHVHIGEVRVVYTRCDGAACTCCRPTGDSR